MGKLICKNCIFWERTPTPDSDIISSKNLWSWGEWLKDNEPCICNICKKEFKGDNRFSTGPRAEEHIKKQHQKVLDKYRNTRYGSCSCEQFRYDIPNYYETKNSPIGALFYMDGEGYSAYFYTDEEFGCIHYKARV